MSRRRPSIKRATLVAAIALAGCVNGSGDAAKPSSSAPPSASLDQIRNVVVIYAENRSFDALYGHFPGAHGLSEVVDASGKPTALYVLQKDRDGSVLSTLPQTWNGVTVSGVVPVVTQAESANLPNAPFATETAFEAGSASHARLTLDTTTRNLWHRFYEHQMQIGADGRGAGFAAWSDAGGLTMGQFDTKPSKLFALAQRYVLADEFFQGAFGGSFLNHQYLICACAPEYPNADTAQAKPMLTTLERPRARSPRSTVRRSSCRAATSRRPTISATGSSTPSTRCSRRTSRARHRPCRRRRRTCRMPTPARRRRYRRRPRRRSVIVSTPGR
jgi:acid phosphatase